MQTRCPPGAPRETWDRIPDNTRVLTQRKAELLPRAVRAVSGSTGLDQEAVTWASSHGRCQADAHCGNTMQGGDALLVSTVQRCSERG